METSDHVPCLVFIGTSIPSRHLFRFENYWLTHEDFKAQVQVGWLPGQVHSDPAKNIIAKFKYLWQTLRIWSRSLSNLKDNIHRIKLVLDLLNSFEEFRDLSLIEWNFHAISEKKLVFLLQQQKAYWQQRGMIKWATLGDASTKFFHANATIKYRRNLITRLVDDSGVSLSSHEDKAAMIWTSFKDRLGRSEFTAILFDLNQYFTPQDHLSQLVEPIEKAEIDQIVKLLPSDKAPGPDGFKSVGPLFVRTSISYVKAFMMSTFACRVSIDHSLL